MKRRLCDEKQTAAGRVKAAIRERIYVGVYGPGSQLRQDELALELGVSHIPVREALIQLANEGLVLFSPYRGAVVTSLTPQELRQVYQVRTILETAALREAVPRLSQAVLEDLKAILCQYCLVDDVVKLRGLYWQFYQTLYAASGNPRLLGLIENQIHGIGHYLRIDFERLSGFREFQTNHQRILDCCYIGDAEAAAAELARDIDQACQRLCNYLEAPEAAASGQDQSLTVPAGPRGGQPGRL